MRKVFFVIIIFFYGLSYAQSPLLDSLKIELKKAKHDTTTCIILLQMIEAEYDDRIWPTYNEKLKSIAIKNINKNSSSSYTKYYAEALNNEGYLANLHNEPKKALAFYYKSLALQEKVNNHSSVATLLNNIANVYQNLGDINKAIELYNKGLKIHIIINDLNGIGRVYNNLGYIYDDLGDIPLALDYYQKSLKIRESIDDKVGVAACLNNIATLYQRQNESLKAEEYYHKSYELQIQTNDILGSANTLSNLGSIFQVLAAKKQTTKNVSDSLYKKAIATYEKALTIQFKYDDKKGVANSYSNLGTVYELLADNKMITKREKDSLLDKTLNFYNLSLKIRNEIEDKNGKSIVFSKLAKVYFEKGDFKSALIYSENCLTLSQELGYPNNIKLASELLSKIFAIRGDFKKAFEMQLLFKQMSDSTFNQENIKATTKNQLKYEYEKKAAADSVKVAEEKKVTTAQLKQEKTQRFALYGGIFLVGLFGVFMFNRFKVTKKQNHLIQIQKTELQHQKELVEEHQKETLDSIHYAKRIQTALIANSDFITQNIPNNFIYFNPKDIVSGDFYWATKHNDKFYLAVCDSTGHGVPGAFMSLLNMGFLSEAIKEKNIEKPNEIFNYVRERLISTISDGGQKDGMDGILICLNNNSNTIEYAAANNEPILIRNSEVIELPKDKMPVGKGEKAQNFALHSIELKSGDSLYLYTDGFADQFGGPKGKKFKYRQLNELLLTIKDSPLSSQKDKLESAFENWRGSQEQVDDVLIIGIKV